MANPLAEEFRKRAKQEDEAANRLIGEEGFAENALSQFSATIMKLDASMRNIAADCLDYFDTEKKYHGIRDEQLRGAIDRNAALRFAAAKAITGDWGAIDRFIDTLTGAANSGGGNTTEQQPSATGSADRTGGDGSGS